MAPECIKVCLELDLEFQLVNLNLLRPLQDLPGFQVKTDFKVIKKSIVVDIFQVKIKKMSNDKVLELNVTIFDKKTDMNGR